MGLLYVFVFSSSLILKLLKQLDNFQEFYFSYNSGKNGQNASVFLQNEIQAETIENTFQKKTFPFFFPFVSFYLLKKYIF